MSRDMLCLAITKNNKLRQVCVKLPHKNNENINYYKIICKNLNSEGERHYCEKIRIELEERGILFYQESENIKYKVPDYLIERVELLLNKTDNNNDLQTIFNPSMEVDYTIKTKKELRELYIQKFIYDTDISYDFKSRFIELINELEEEDYCVIYESHI